jgi:ectoine hydroxylase-related dioxygenase (phytanoyl-CoA dioxygenase family)
VLNAVPGSHNQAWHRDNQRRGLSIIVPLVDFTPENGPTQVLLGSHLPQAWPRVAQAGGARAVVAPAGAIVAYDSRTFHRGLGNGTAAGRPAVIFCYDREGTPPPGCGPYESLADSYVAGALNLLSAGWLLCASVGKEDAP